MSLGGAPAKFPGQEGTGIPPTPTRENPGGVYPHSDPQAAPAETVPGTGGETQPRSDVGNPYLLAGIMDRVDQALGDAVSAIEAEGTRTAAQGATDPVVRKFKSWRDEVQNLKRAVPGERAPAGAERGDATEGGMFTD